jgi:pre-mRNA-splicing factor SYF1
MDANELHFEEEIQRNPYNLKVWWNYVSYKTQQANDGTGSRGGNCGADVFIIYERALKCLPRSYKLWHGYLKERADSLSGTRITNQKYDILINTYERAIVHMNKMPRIWIEYCELMTTLQKVTKSRETFDRALQALPITQHSRVWDLYIAWATECGVAETAIRVYRRFLMIEPSRRESFVDYLETIGQFGEAARQLADCLNDDRFVSPTGKTQHQMWMHLCDICAANPSAVVSTLNVEAIIRSGITR